MSDRGTGVEWVETTEVVIIEECLPPDTNNPTDPVTSVIALPILEPAEAPIQKLLDTVVPGENNSFYCEECLSLFQDQNDPSNISGPSFILDFPTAMGVLQRALLTLPFGLMIGRSSIPNAGIGVVNHGPTLSPGMHFGPYEGESISKEDALSSDFSWEIHKGERGYEYIGGAKETHSNWMRYVNSARNKEEANLVAVQYKGSILYHCCRTVHAGDELTVWPSSKMHAQSSDAWTQFWFTKLNTRESHTPASTEIFLCPHCQLSFTTENYLQRHVEYFHPEQSGDVEVFELASPDADTGLEEPAETQVEVTQDSKSCSDCGKTFKQIAHLKRHKLCVHANKRPYCCTHCKRSFCQASGLIRHQLIHKKPFFMPQKGETSEQKQSLLPEISNLDATKEDNVNQKVGESVSSTDNENSKAAETSPELEEQPPKCSDCDMVFTHEALLKQHVMLVHSNIRPYVCTLCQKGFRQYSDLARHLKWHKKQSQKLEANIAANQIILFGCPVCMDNLSTVEDLKEHIKTHHPDVVFVESQNDEPVGDSELQAVSPQPQQEELNLPPPKSTSQRPQRLKARSKVSALTKLIAPKRRKVQNPKALTNLEFAEKSPSEAEKPSANKVKPAKKYKWYSCNRCRRTYTNPKLLKTHKCLSKQHKCLQCGAVFSKSGFLRRHEQTVHGNLNASSCERCGKVFANANTLKQHQKTSSCDKYHCNSELFSCPFCQFSFTIKNYLIKHIRRHHPIEYLSHCESETLIELGWEDEDKEKLYKCTLCEKSYANPHTFKNHACIQQVKVLYLCPDCGKGFTNKYGLKQHQRIHTGEKPYSCPQCTKSFAHVGQLNVHLRTHTGERPYLCTHCGESFRQSGDLKRHERKHTGVRPHNCPECGKSFSRPQSLKAHQLLHLGQRMFKCTQCGKSFSRNYHLRRHHQKMHL